MIMCKKMGKQYDKMKDEEYIDTGKMNKKDFTRKRKIDLSKMIMFVLGKRGVTLKMEINNFKELMVDKIPDITDSAICQQRKKLNPEIFRKMMRSYIEDTYDEGHDYETYKGYIVTAIDGMKMELPNVPELEEKYGGVTGREDQRKCVRASTSSIYDVVNNMVIDTQIAPFKTSEKKLALENIAAMVDIFKDRIDLSKVIIIFDRGYPSMELLSILDGLEVKYLLRLDSRKFSKEVKAMKTEDEDTEIEVTKSRLNAIKDENIKALLKEQKSIKCRFVKYKLKTKEEEILITNLSREEFKEEEVGVLYSERWKIEMAYDIAKNKLEVQNISGQSKIVVEQDYYAQMYLLNIAEDLRKEANKKVSHTKENGYKYDYQVNMNMVVGIMRSKLIKLMVRAVFFDEDVVAEYHMLIDELSKYVEPIRPGRQNPRKPYKTRNKYRPNMRRSI